MPDLYLSYGALASSAPSVPTPSLTSRQPDPEPGGFAPTPVSAVSAAPPQAPLEYALRDALAGLASCLPHDLVAVYEHRDATLRRVAAFGPRTPFTLDSLPASTPATDVARILSERGQLVAESGFARIYSDAWAPAQRLLLPLVAHDRCVGILLVDVSHAGEFGPSLLALARAYAGVAALALDANSRREGMAQPLPSASPAVAGRPATLSTPLAHGLKPHSVTTALAALSPGELVEGARSSAMREVVVRARQVARTDAPVLMIGDAGTGKRLLGQAIVAWSDRAGAPLVHIDCARHPAGELDRVLFGEDGVMPGLPASVGSLAAAGRGTVMLSNVDHLPLALQGKLLELLQRGSFQAGGQRLVRADFRLLATSRSELQQVVANGQFRAELYERLAVFPLRLPSLAQRRQDALVIAAQFVLDRARRGQTLSISASAQRWIDEYEWPGNVSELINVLERATMLSSSGSIDLDVLPAASAAVAGSSAHADKGAFPTFVENERSYFERALSLTAGKLHGADGAANLVGLKPTTLQSRLKKLGIQPRMWKRRVVDQPGPVSGVHPYGENLRSATGNQ